ncbi:MAG: uroporphyrinogen-III synthase [Alphaproteobacteria bacterium]|nr:uroporphyrinogen-III synthase [Alphaproteobacteria bacterium]
MAEKETFNVLITRPLEEAAPLASALEAKGHRVILNPLLTIEACPLPVCSSLPKAWILTSKQALDALTQLDPERERPVFTVGDGTAAACQTAGFEAFEGGGDGARLVEFIMSHNLPGSAPYLHLSGEDIRVDMATRLQSEGIACVRAVVYRARPNPVMTPDLKTALTQQTLTHAPFYSLRTAQIFISLLKETPLFTLKEVCLLALSKAILEELACFEWRDCQVTRDPFGWLCEEGQKK